MNSEAGVDSRGAMPTPAVPAGARAYCPQQVLVGSSYKEKCKKRLILLVPVERIELPTFGLQNRCSTAELNRHTLVIFRLNA